MFVVLERVLSGAQHGIILFKGTFLQVQLLLLLSILNDRLSLSHFNLIYLSSVLPPNSHVIVSEKPEKPEGDGARGRAGPVGAGAGGFAPRPPGYF